jgi:hypothetical protein
MPQPLSEQQIEQLLTELKHPQVARRQAAADEIAQRGIRDPRLDQVLERIVRKDPSRAVAEAATSALGRPPPPRPSGHIYSSPYEKIRDFVIGFVGWVAINAVLWLSSDRVSLSSYWSRDMQFQCAAFMLFVLNVAGLIVLAFTRRWIAFGSLVAFATNSLISLVLGSGLNALCGVPFYVNTLKPF